MARAPRSRFADDSALLEQIQRRGGPAFAATALAQECVELLTELLAYDQTGEISSLLRNAIGGVRVQTEVDHNASRREITVASVVERGPLRNRRFALAVPEEVLLSSTMAEQGIVSVICDHAQQILRQTLSRVALRPRNEAERLAELAIRSENEVYDLERHTPWEIPPSRTPASAAAYQVGSTTLRATSVDPDLSNFRVALLTTDTGRSAVTRAVSVLPDSLCPSDELLRGRLVSMYWSIRARLRVCPPDPDIQAPVPVELYYGPLIRWLKDAADLHTPGFTPSPYWGAVGQVGVIHNERVMLSDLADLAVLIEAVLAQDSAYQEAQRTMALRLQGREDLCRALAVLLREIDAVMRPHVTAFTYTRPNGPQVAPSWPAVMGEVVLSRVLFTDISGGSVDDLLDLLLQFFAEYCPYQPPRAEFRSTTLTNPTYRYFASFAELVTVKAWLSELPHLSLPAVSIADGLPYRVDSPLWAAARERLSGNTPPTIRPGVRGGRYRDPAPRREAPRSTRRVIIRGKMSNTPNE